MGEKVLPVPIIGGCLQLIGAGGSSSAQSCCKWRQMIANDVLYSTVTLTKAGRSERGAQMNRLGIFLSASRLRFTRYVAPLLLVLAASLLEAPPLHAGAISTSYIQVSNLTITPSSGTVMFL